MQGLGSLGLPVQLGQGFGFRFGVSEGFMPWEDDRGDEVEDDWFYAALATTLLDPCILNPRQ